MSDLKEGFPQEKAVKKEWSFSKKVDEVEKTIRGEEVENGWIITISKNWKEPLENGGYDYKYETLKYISKENPMDKLKTDKQEEKESTVVSLLKEVANASGMIMVN